MSDEAFEPLEDPHASEAPPRQPPPPLDASAARRMRRALRWQRTVMIGFVATTVLRQFLLCLFLMFLLEGERLSAEAWALAPRRIPASADDPDAYRGETADGDEYFYKYNDYDADAFRRKGAESDLPYERLRLANNAFEVSFAFDVFLALPLLASVYLGTPVGPGDEARRTRLRSLAWFALLAGVGYGAGRHLGEESPIPWIPVDTIATLLRTPFVATIVAVFALQYRWIWYTLSSERPKVDPAGWLAMAAMLAAAYVALQPKLPLQLPLRLAGATLWTLVEIACVSVYFRESRKLIDRLRERESEAAAAQGS